jgi:hypothetical protein
MVGAAWSALAAATVYPPAPLVARRKIRMKRNVRTVIMPMAVSPFMVRVSPAGLFIPACFGLWIILA